MEGGLFKGNIQTFRSMIYYVILRFRQTYILRILSLDLNNWNEKCYFHGHYMI